MIAVDSNMLIYALNGAVPEHRAAVKAIKRAEKEGILVNTLILMEVCHHLVKRLGAVDGPQRASGFLAGPFGCVEEFDETLLGESLEVLARFTHLGIGGRDASVIATMNRHEVRRLLTHDEAFKRVPGVEVVDPCEGIGKRR